MSLIAICLSLQSIATAFLHYTIAQAQRQAYERVVKLLGLRRLTTGFYDITAAPDSKKQKQGMLMDFEDEIDPTALDPIQAAMFIANMYSDESKAIADRPKETYPESHFHRIQKFYMKHDKSRLDGIELDLGLPNWTAEEEEKFNEQLRMDFGVDLSEIPMTGLEAAMNSSENAPASRKTALNNSKNQQ